MPEIRASLTVELHRSLKYEAVREGIPLKELVARILAKHACEQNSFPAKTEEREK